MGAKFDGEGFSTEPITGPEAAKFRHMYKEVQENWVVIPGDVLEVVESAATIVFAVEVVSKIIKVGGPVGITMAAIGASLKYMGVI